MGVSPYTTVFEPHTTGVRLQVLITYTAQPDGNIKMVTTTRRFTTDGTDYTDSQTSTVIEGVTI